MLPARRGDCSADGDRVPAVASSSGAAVSEQSAIEWTDATWNPVTGCTKVSPGCANCYIERTPPFRMAGRRFVKGAIPVLLHPERLDQPLRWRKPRWVFLCSLADLFHEDVPEEFIQQVFVTMEGAPRHTFQVLTKRPERMRQLLTDAVFRSGVESVFGSWPLPNVHLGVSVENQRMADERIPELLRCTAVVHFISCEPLLGLLDGKDVGRDAGGQAMTDTPADDARLQAELDWWRGWLSPATLPRLLGVYGMRYLPFWFMDFQDLGRVCDIGSGPISAAWIAVKLVRHRHVGNNAQALNAASNPIVQAVMLAKVGRTKVSYKVPKIPPPKST